MATPFTIARLFARSLGLRVPVSITSLTGLRSAYSLGKLVRVRDLPVVPATGLNATLRSMLRAGRHAGLGRDDAIKLTRASGYDASWAEARGLYGEIGVQETAYRKVQAEGVDDPLSAKAHIRGAANQANEYKYTVRVPYKNVKTGATDIEYRSIESNVPLSVTQIIDAQLDQEAERYDVLPDWEVEPREVVMAEKR